MSDVTDATWYAQMAALQAVPNDGVRRSLGQDSSESESEVSGSVCLSSLSWRLGLKEKPGFTYGPCHRLQHDASSVSASFHNCGSIDDWSCRIPGICSISHPRIRNFIFIAATSHVHALKFA